MNIDIYIGWPGSVYDARIFANSTLFKEASNGSMLQGDTMGINGCDIPIFIVRDSLVPRPIPMLHAEKREEGLVREIM